MGGVGDVRNGDLHVRVVAVIHMAAVVVAGDVRVVAVVPAASHAYSGPRSRASSHPSEAGVQREQVQKLEDRQDDDECFHHSQSSWAVATGVNLLRRKSHGEKNKKPGDQRGGRGGSERVAPEQTHVVNAGEDGCQSNHTRDQRNRQEEVLCHIVTHSAFTLTVVRIKVPVERPSSQTGGDQVQAEVDQQERRRQPSSQTSTRHRSKLASPN